jgi:hypothetical protein
MGAVALAAGGRWVGIFINTIRRALRRAVLGRGDRQVGEDERSKSNRPLLLGLFRPRVVGLLFLASGFSEFSPSVTHEYENQKR